MEGSSRLSVLHLVPYFPPERIGGVGEVAAHLHRALLAAGHDSKVLTAGRGREDPRVRRISPSPLGFLLRSALHSDLLAGCDLVHCHHGDPLPLLLALRLRRDRPRLLVTFHVSSRAMGHSFRPYRVAGRRFGRGWRNRLYRLLTAPFHQLADGLALRLADEISFISRSGARDVLGDEGAATARVIYNALPERPGGEERDAPAAAPTELLYVGKHSDRKRTLVLPHVLAAVRRELPDARLRLVGLDLDELPELAGEFRRLGLLAAVTSEGPLASSEIRRFYDAAGVLLVPSAYEGLPMVIVEAFQCGLPCVATRVSGHPEIIDDGVNGFLVELDRPREMAERCLRILGDAELRRRMGAAARRRARDRFGLDRQLEEYLALYREITA